MRVFRGGACPGGGGEHGACAHGSAGDVGGRVADDLDDTRRWGGGGGTGASRTRDRGEACGGRPERGGGEWAATTVKRPPQPPAQPPVHQLSGPDDAATPPQGTPAAAADRTQRPDATCEGKNG